MWLTDFIGTYFVENDLFEFERCTGIMNDVCFRFYIFQGTVIWFHLFLALLESRFPDGTEKGRCKNITREAIKYDIMAVLGAKIGNLPSMLE